MPDGNFDDLIETSDEGVDIIPSHDMLGDFTSNLELKISYETGMQSMSREEYPRFELLYELLWEKHEFHEEYDAILIYPNARTEDLLYNVAFALRTLIAPVKPAGKGNLSLDGIDELVGNMENELEIGIVPLASFHQVTARLTPTNSINSSSKTPNHLTLPSRSGIEKAS